MQLSTFAEPGDQNVISADYKSRVKIRGVNFTIELEPGCWVGSARLGILVCGKIGGGTFKSRRSFKRAAMSDLKQLTKRVRLETCSVALCKRLYIKDDTIGKTNPKRLCYPHREADIYAQYEKTSKKERLATARFDARMKTKGYRYKAMVWIHRNDRDDSWVDLYYFHRPARKKLINAAKRRGSRVLNDFTVIEL